MAEPQNTVSGFSEHVREQLQQAARDVPVSQPNRGRGHRGRGHQHHPHAHQHGYRGHIGPQRAHQSNPQSWSQQPMANLTDMSSFPPLGASHPQPSVSAHQQQQSMMQLPSQNPQYLTQPQSHHHLPPALDQHPARFQHHHHANGDHQFRGHRGAYRGRGHHKFGNNQFQPHNQHHLKAQSPDDFHRPAPTQRHLFTPVIHPHFQSMDEQRAIHRRIMDQSDFLNQLANQALRCRITIEEQQAKERFRKELETIAQKAIAENSAASMSFAASEVGLKVYGSLGSGFGVASSDMDLLLAFPQDRGPLGDIETESQRQLEKALLDAGIGARLLTKTRVPILRVCQQPGTELLKNLRECRLMWEQESKTDNSLPVNNDLAALPVLTELQITATREAFAELALDAHEVPLPTSPVLERSKLEYDGDCGILCDINFANYLALENTRLLKTYGMCDPRVIEVGVFVKTWAKARDIKTPYRGTLSSYGYLMLVLHYLMNVAYPPLIPNLQELARQKDAMEGKTEIELFKGFDTRFVEDMDEVRSVLQVMPRNHESVGSLLRGFFHYYADTRGFHWNQDVISIRSPGGRLTKRAKGWTEAKWAGDKQHVRLRYLLAIEDPFELEHNVGRTVGHSGIVAIRDEFRRAWSAIEHIQQDEDRAWFWMSQDGQKVPGEEMMSTAENRGDLLRKDQEYHRTKARQLRQALEAKEKALRSAATQDDESRDEVESNGMFKVESKSSQQDYRYCFPLSSPTIIHNDEPQVKTRQPKLPIQEAIPKRYEEGVDVSIHWFCCKRMDNLNGMSVPTRGDTMCRQWNGFAAHQALKFKIQQLQSMAPKLPAKNASMNRMQSNLEDFQATQNRATSGLGVDAQRGCSHCTQTHATNKLRCQPGCFSNDPVRDRCGLDHISVSNVRQNSQSIKTNARTEEHTEAARNSRHCCTGDDHEFLPNNVLLLTEPATFSRSPQCHAGHRSSMVIEDKEPLSQCNQLADSIVQNGSSLRNFKSQNVTEDSGSPSYLCGPCVDSESARVPIASQPEYGSIDNKQDGSTANSRAPSPEVQMQSPSSNLPGTVREQLVPLTLFPDVPSHLRPRDEDPNIMPIPRSLNFKFDPRQLADLDVIRRGGNGCAKAGEEFEIEGDGEYGGCGIMAESTSSTVCFRSDTGRQLGGDNCPAGGISERSMDDVVGLLDELPRFLDN